MNCSVEGCKRDIRYKELGLCHLHYMKEWGRKHTCKLPFCNKIGRKDGFCKVHHPDYNPPNYKLSQR